MLHLLLAESTDSGNTGTPWSTYVIYAVLILLLVGFVVWTFISNKKRQKQEQEKLAGIRVGDKVKTIGGVCGVIVAIDDEENTFTMETGSGKNVSYIKFDKGAIYQTAPANAPASQSVAETKAEDKGEPFEETAPAAPAAPAENAEEENKE